MRIPSRLIPVLTIGWSALATSVGLVAISGCAEGEKSERNFTQGPASSPIAASKLAVVVAERSSLGQTPGRLGQATGAPQADAATPTPKLATAGRKIIYDAFIDLVTEDLNKLEASLLRMIEVEGAYIADSNRTGATGTTREGRWKIRVPVDAYAAFVRGVIGLGELVSTKAQSQDVSAEYYDLDARTTSKKVEEARLLKHLADSTGRLDEILAVERELSRVRSEIEQMQGRLAVLSNLTALATVTVTASEIKDYIPPQAPTLGLKVARTFAGSLESLQNLGETVLLAGVALAPWIPLLILAGLFAWLVARRLHSYL